MIPKKGFKAGFEGSVVGLSLQFSLSWLGHARSLGKLGLNRRRNRMKLGVKAYTKFISFWRRDEATKESTPPVPIRQNLADQIENWKDQLVTYKDGMAPPLLD